LFFCLGDLLGTVVFFFLVDGYTWPFLARCGAWAPGKRPEDRMRGLSLGTPRGKVPDWLVFDGVMNEDLGFIR
jgi:hypothetical protein